MAEPKNIKLKNPADGGILYPVTLGSNVNYESGVTVESLKPAEVGAQVNVIETVKVNGTALTPTNKAVNVVIPEAAEYTIVKQQTAESGYAATYNLTKDGTAVGASINIPKDYLVKSASVKTCTEKDVPVEGYVVGDKYIDFIINTKDGSGTDEHLYIKVTDLIDVYTAGNGLVLTDHKFSVRLTSNGGLALTGTDGERSLGVSVDGSTIGLNTSSGALEVVSGGITNTQIASALKSTTIAVAASASDDKLATEKAVRTELDTKQASLDSTQLAAVNSGITSDLVTKYNGYESTIAGKQAQLSDNQLAATNSGITASKVSTYDGYATTIAGKQDQLSDAQLLAVNSGITAAKVSTYDGYATGKQDALSTAQLASVNSGITAAKVSTYDGYATGKQDALSTAQLAAVNSGVTGTKVSAYDTHIADTDIHVTAEQKTAWTGKQDALSVAQLTATNSGITASKVSTYDGYATTIAGKQDQLTAGDYINITNNVIKATYAAFTGSSGATAGTIGLVPAPGANTDGFVLTSGANWVAGLTWEVVTSA